MYSLIVENAAGATLALTNSQDYQVVNIDGLYPPVATINTSTIALGDGEVYNSSVLQSRNIVITLYVARNIEHNRTALYQYFKPKQFCRLYYKTASRDVYIDGYVETFNISMFAVTQKVQISILCPAPTFKARTENEYYFSWTAGSVQFPLSVPESGIEFGGIESVSQINIVNSGDVETGVKIELSAIDNVIAPAIINLLTNTTFALNYQLLPGDVATITTERGNKRVTLLRNGVTTNIINRVAQNPDWFSLQPLDNVFAYQALSGGENLDVKFTMRNEYLGV